MFRVAKLSSQERSDLFTEAAAQMAIRPSILEKDFWVCLVLKFLFSDHSLQKHMVFKGGTSLSKVYGLIQRFSEDIDLILDWQLLGFDRAEPLRDQLSKTQQDKFNKEVNRLAGVFIAEKLTPELDTLLRDMEVGLSAEVDPGDPLVVNVRYPAAFAESYIRPEVRLEIGPLGSWIPSKLHTIQPYAADVLPHLFDDPSCSVLTIVAERTFWEKATILHQEAHRQNLLPQRHSRHYYDLYKLALSPVRNEALSALPLLAEVVQFKQRFYPSQWARYDLARPGTFRLLPTSEAQTKALQLDYEQMQIMLFGDRPEFHSIITGLGELEAEINSLRS
ncbi:MAG: nucleotidyl transferase AbiEii/AbiGii toxin family protein [Bryobacterales bacterium]|nr:nucleotidyl transferase AbiEii/AbiGii toxin family protein [Bryobacterales bacterium]